MERVLRVIEVIDAMELREVKGWRRSRRSKLEEEEEGWRLEERLVDSELRLRSTPRLPILFY